MIAFLLLAGPRPAVAQEHAAPLPFRLTGRVGVLGTDGGTHDGCSGGLAYTTGTLEVRTRGRWFGLASGQWFVSGVREDCAVLVVGPGTEITFLDPVEVERRIGVGIGRELVSGRGAGVETAVVIGIQDTGADRMLWLGTSALLTVTDHVVFGVELGFDRLPDQGRGRGTRWGRSVGASLGLRL